MATHLSAPSGLLLVIALNGLSLTAHAGRPLSVDDAGVDPFQEGHVEIWWQGARHTRGVFFVAPEYSVANGLALGATLARDQNDRTTLQGLQVKWRWTAMPQDTGCYAATRLAVQRSTRSTGNPGLTGLLIGTCTTEWGAVHANAGAQRERPGNPWLPTWGLALERPWGAVVAHVEAFGIRRSAPTFQTGLRWEWAPGWQLDGSLGRQSGTMLLSAGIKHSF